jgi:hypothetical protein
MGVLEAGTFEGKSTQQVVTQGIAPGISKKTSHKIVDPLNLSKSGKKKPAKTAEELALEKRTQMALDKSIGDQEDMIKAMARGQLGRASLLSGAPKTAKDAAAGKRSGGGGSTGSLLGGGSTSGGAAGGSRGGRTNSMDRR